MHSFPLYITEEHKTYFENRRSKTGIPMAVQIREAMDDYMLKHKEGK